MMAKRPNKHDLTTTPYGRKFLEIAKWNNSSKTSILSKYMVSGRLFIPVVDRAYWLDDDQRRCSGPWIDALEHVDKRGDKGPLIALLKSQRALPRLARVYLADLIERYELRRPAHRPRTPAYVLSNAESRLTLAKEHVRAHRASGMSYKDAVAAAAKDWSIGENMLATFCAGRRGSSRRMKKRTRP
jgi:hypothetical protein